MINYLPAKGQIALVADDNESTQAMLKSYLEDDGYNVICVYDGVEAVDAFKQYTPNLVLMDINMPYLDGWKATMKIREISTEHFVPILFVSASNCDDDIIRSIEAGGDDFISIPFSEKIFKAKLKALRRIGDMYRQFYLMQQEQIRDQEIAEQLFSQVIESENLGLDSISVVKQAATIFSGDVILTAQSPNGVVYILLGDFTGHGLKSVVGAFSLSEIFRTMIHKGYNSKVVLNQINQKLYNILPNDMFLACALVSVSPIDRICYIWNGGLPDVFIFDSNNRSIKHRISSKHPPLGIMPKMLGDVEDVVINYSNDDHIIMASDGVIEARNEDGDMFGDGKFMEACIGSLGKQKLAQAVIDKVNDFCGSMQQEDDMSLISFPVSMVENSQPVLAPACAISQEVMSSETEDGKELWSWHITLTGQQLAKVNLVPLVMNYIQEIEGKASHWNNLYTILTELFVNSLDHGILELNSSIKNSPEGFVEYFRQRDQKLMNLDNGRVEIMLVRLHRDVGGKIILKLDDSGSGFNVQKWLNTGEPNMDGGMDATFVGLSGRGIKLVQSLCESLTYSDNGTSVEAEYSWVDGLT